MPMNLEEYTDSSGTEDDDLMVRLIYVSQVIDDYLCPSGLVGSFFLSSEAKVSEI